jgi:hypothetical protein
VNGGRRVELELLLDVSVAPSTKLKNGSLWRRWENRTLRRSWWIRQFLNVLFFGSGDGTETNYVTAEAIAWRHAVAGYSSPTKSPLISAIKMLATLVVRRAPLTVVLLC